MTSETSSLCSVSRSFTQRGTVSGFLVFTFSGLLLLGCSPSKTATAEINSSTSSGSPSTDQGRREQRSPLASFSGRVVSVEDGDTIMVLDSDNRTYKIRLQGIDAPEGGQAFGDSSREHPSGVTQNRPYMVTSKPAIEK